MVKNIKKIVGILRANTLFIIKWDILQSFTLKNLALHHFLTKKSYVICKNSSSIPT